MASLQDQFLKAGLVNKNKAYQNPNDPSQSWTGRGRQPKWMAEALADGKKPDDFFIQ